MRAWFDSDEPYLLDVTIPASENVYPMMPAGGTLTGLIGVVQLDADGKPVEGGADAGKSGGGGAGAGKGAGAKAGKGSAGAPKGVKGGSAARGGAKGKGAAK